jgi:hypothetical protein
MQGVETNLRAHGIQCTFLNALLGVLAEAHAQDLLDFGTALARLRQTNFYLSASLVDRIHQRLSAGRRQR